MEQMQPVKQIISLNGEWEFCQQNGNDWKPAQVPGSVHTDLLALGLIPDPFVGEHETDVQWVAEKDWQYRKTFRVDPAVLDVDQVFLVCEGLDTLAEVAINDESVFQADNQFRTYRHHVKGLLKPGENSIHIRFQSPLQYVAPLQKKKSLPGANGAIPGATYLRKSPYHFGWDWGPQLPVIGIWKDIYLEAITGARLADVHLRQKHTIGPVEVSAAVVVERWMDGELLIEMQVTSPEGEDHFTHETITGEQGLLSVQLEHPEIWWPNGLGAQPLYNVVVRVFAKDTLLDEKVYRLGLRQIELRQEQDEWGRSFTFVVNGVPLFAKGANWIPPDSFPTRIDRDRLRFLIASAASVNQNMLRVWGGGYYESDEFYDLCDELGILVWQDFIFACGIYPLDDEAYVKNIKQEVIDQTRRLRHHASLALWCGNNEMELGWVAWGWSLPTRGNLKQAYREFFHHTLPDWINGEDPDGDYWPSSPSSGHAFDDPNGDLEGDSHHWNVWHGMEPLRGYRKKLSRFVSEFGMQSIPQPATLAEFAEPSEWKLMSKVMNHHQRAPKGNGKIAMYLLENFRLPKTFDDMVYVSQILQAEALREGVEHWRRNWPRTAGALYWQLNDCWPVLSWSTIDYYGRWKAAQYAARRFYAPLILSLENDGMGVKAFACNDQTTTWDGEFKWSLERLNGEVLESGSDGISIPPLSSTLIKTFDFTTQLSREDRAKAVLVAELYQAGQRTAQKVSPFVSNRELALEEPLLEVTVLSAVADMQICLTSNSLARFVELSLEGAEVFFTDNDFDLPARRPVTVSCQLPAGWTHEQAAAALRVRTLYHSYTL